LLDVFFFQAEDGIRDFHVTGVQTCALPIYRRRYDPADLSLRPNVPNVIRHTQTTTYDRAKIRENLAGYYAHISALDDQLARLLEIGRASCRARAYIAAGARGVYEKRDIAHE